MFAREIFGTSFCQPIITMFIYIVEAIFFVWNFELRKMPFTAIGTIITGILY